ncbi:MAG: hypothetical protein JXA62_01385 [Candidatus Aminicenantes bacterium]|nr:hypothetical protein [Candidatus Aminicenantes bacterium]
MKRTLWIVIMAFLVVPFLGAQDLYDADHGHDALSPNADPEKVSISRSGGYGPYRSMHPVVKVLSTGSAIVLWEEGPSERECNVVYRFLDIQTGKWNPPLDQLPRVAAARLRSATFPQVVEDMDGIIHVIFQDGTAQVNRDIYHTKLVGNSWERKLVLYDRPNSAWPRINLDPETGDLYASWHKLIPHAEGLNIIEGDSEIVYSVLKKGATHWSESFNYSNAYLNHLNNPIMGSITIHHSSAWANGHLHGLFMDGEEGSWAIAGQSMPRGGFTGKYGEAPVMVAGAAYWPELEADSEGNLYGVYTSRDGNTYHCYKPANGPWQARGSVGPGQLDFIGLTVAKNDVAYCITKSGYAEGFLPVVSRFTEQKIAPLIQVDNSSRFPIRPEIDVDNQGAMHCVWVDRNCNESKTDHCATGVWYRKISQEPGGPTVDIEGVPAVIITKEETVFNGRVVKVNGSIAKHTWYIHELGLWQSGDDLKVTFATPGFYTVHYYVADNNFRMGHKAITIEAIDAPYQPTQASVSESLISGFLLRLYINELTWKSDARNDEKFENLTHFNIYRRQVGSTDWGSVYTQVDFAGSANAYQFRDDSPGFKTTQEAAAWEYAVTVVADVSGAEKESKKTVFSRN